MSSVRARFIETLLSARSAFGQQDAGEYGFERSSKRTAAIRTPVTCVLFYRGVAEESRSDAEKGFLVLDVLFTTEAQRTQRNAGKTLMGLEEQIPKDSEGSCDALKPVYGLLSSSGYTIRNPTELQSCPRNWSFGYTIRNSGEFRSCPQRLRREVYHASISHSRHVSADAGPGEACQRLFARRDSR